MIKAISLFQKYVLLATVLGFLLMVGIFNGKFTTPDDSTLNQHSIIDGDTVNIHVETTKGVSIEVKCGPKTYKHEVNLSMQVKELKQRLINKNQVAFSFHDFLMEKVLHGKEDVILSNESLPLYLYGVRNGSTLNVIHVFVMVNIVNEKGETYYKSLHRNTIPKDLKQMICVKSHNNNFQFSNVLVFIKSKDNVYKKLKEVL